MSLLIPEPLLGELDTSASDIVGEEREERWGEGRGELVNGEPKKRRGWTP